MKISKSGLFKNNKKSIMHNVKFPSMFPEKQKIKPLIGMKQKDFLQKTRGMDMRRFSILDGAGVIAGLDCRPFNKHKHNLDDKIDDDDEKEEPKTDDPQQSSDSNEYDELEKEYDNKSPTISEKWAVAKKNVAQKNIEKRQEQLKNLKTEAIINNLEPAKFKKLHYLKDKDKVKYLNAFLQEKQEKKDLDKKIKKYQHFKRVGELKKLELQKKKLQVRRKPKPLIDAGLLTPHLNSNGMSNTLGGGGFLFDKPNTKKPKQKGLKFDFGEFL